MDELSTDECFKAVDKFHEAGIKGIVVGGGEPMLRPDLFEIAKYAKGKGMSLSIATNGTLINEDNCKDIITQLIGKCNFRGKYCYLDEDGGEARTDANTLDTMAEKILSAYFVA